MLKMEEEQKAQTFNEARFKNLTETRLTNTLDFGKVL